MSIFDDNELNRIFKNGFDPTKPYTNIFNKPDGMKIEFGFGVVTDNKDPQKLGRVKVSFPSMDSDSESRWAPIVRSFAGKGSGMMIIPDVGDKVVCAFVNMNIKMPVVMGVVFHKKQKPPISPLPGNEKKVISTASGAKIELEDNMGLEKITITTGDGKMKIKMDAIGGIKVINNSGEIEIETKAVELKAKNGQMIYKKGPISIKAGKDIVCKASKNIKFKAGKDFIAKGKKIDLNGSAGVTAKGKQIAVEGDKVIGIDTHNEMMPSPSGLVPLPMIPNPYIGALKDKLSKDVTVKGKKAATKGSKSKAEGPGHIVIPPGVQFQKAPNNEGEVSSGTESSVKINNKEACVLLAGVKTCSDPSPQETSKVFAVGFPLGMALNMMKKEFNEKQSKAKQNKGEGKSKSDIPKKYQCTKAGHPVDVATGSMFTDNVDFTLEGPIPIKWERSWFSKSEYKGPLGYGWHHSYDLVLEEVEEKEIIIVRLSDGSDAEFPFLKKGEQFYSRSDKLTLLRDNSGYVLKDYDLNYYRFDNINSESSVYKLVRLEDNIGNSIQFKYNAFGYLEKILDSANRIIDIILDDKNRIDKILIPHPDKENKQIEIIEYSYDYMGNLIIAEDFYKNKWDYKYDNHLMVQETNRNGLTFYFQYEIISDEARCTRTWGDGKIYDTKFAYNIKEKTTVVEDSLGRKRIYYWLDSGLVTDAIDNRGNKSTKLFSEFNELIRYIDELGNHFAYEYDDRGNLSKVLNPDGTVYEIKYNEENMPIEVINEIGAKWNFEYDDSSRIVKEIDPLNKIIINQYDNRNLISITEHDGSKTEFKYDKIGNLIELISPDNTKICWKYDNWSRCIDVVFPMNISRKFELDPLHRVKKIIEADSNEFLFDYDPEGNIIHAKDDYNEAKFEYTSISRLAARIQNGTKVEFKYDREGRLTGVKNENGLIYEFDLDENGEIIKESGFDGITRKYKRNAAGQVEYVVRPNGITTKFGYDVMGRVISVSHSDGTSETYKYRADGLMIEAENKDILCKFERDLLGKTVKEWQGQHWVKSNFDKLEKRINIESSLGAIQKINYSLMGDVEKVSLSNKENVNDHIWEAGFKYNEIGQEVERSLPGNIKSIWKRDEVSRPIEHSISKETELIRTRKYFWNKNDRLKKIVDSVNGNITYKYDKSGNLISEKNSNGDNILRIPDAVGNLFRTKDTSDRKYGKAGELLESKVKNGIIKYEYDEEGNLAKKVEPGDKVWRYQWNAFGMLEKVIRPDGKTVFFTYDSFARRISKTFNGKRTYWIWDGNNPFHEWSIDLINIDIDSSNIDSKKADRIRNEQERVLTGREINAPPSHLSKGVVTWLFEPDTSSPIAKIDGYKKYSIISDHIGTPIQMFDEKGAQVWAVDLDIYGSKKNNSVVGSSFHCPFRFQGQYEDEETGLYYNRFRYYDPESGEYISQDPLKLTGGFGVYAYVHNPLTWIDAFGLILGGSYGQVRKFATENKMGGEVHHMPAQSTYTHLGDISHYKGPGIHMSEADHAATASFRNVEGAAKYRAKQESLIKQGRFDKAMEMDIKDVKKNHGSKYNKSMHEMIDYSEKEGHITKRQANRLRKKVDECPK